VSLSSTIRTAATFVLSFALAKGMSFVAAMTIPRLVDTATYGAIELAMTVGILVSSVMGLGVPAAATRMYLVDRNEAAQFLLAANALWLAVIGLVAAFVVARLGYDDAIVCCAAILGLYGLQFSASTYTRMRGFIHFSGWFDNITMLLVCGLLLALIGRPYSKLADTTLALLLLSAGLGLGAGAVLSKAPLRKLAHQLREALALGLPIMLFASSSLLVFGTMRIAIGRTLSLADVAAYSLCARVSLILVFLSQVLATGFFRRLYQMEGAEVSKIFTAWIVVLSGSATVLAVAAHFAAPLLVVGTDISAVKVDALFASVTVQTSLWILNSNLEMYIVRELKSQQAALVFVLTAAAGLVAGAILHAAGTLDLAMIVNLYSFAMIGVLLIQMRLLSAGGIRFIRAYLALPLLAGPWLVGLLP
jgi:O-antigen/teichoic acid export membrane protein